MVRLAQRLHFLVLLVILFIGCTLSAETGKNNKSTRPIVNCLVSIGDSIYSSSNSKAKDFCKIENNKSFFWEYISNENSRVSTFPLQDKQACASQWESLLSSAAIEVEKEIDAGSGDISDVNIVFNAKFDGYVAYVMSDRFQKGIESDNDSSCFRSLTLLSFIRRYNVRLLSTSGILENKDSENLANLDKWAYWLIALHADEFPDIQEKSSQIFERLAIKGVFPGPKAAQLVDRVLRNSELPLKYGTYFKCQAGVPSSYLINDQDKLNSRRATMNLEPYEDWLSSIKSC